MSEITRIMRTNGFLKSFFLVVTVIVLLVYLLLNEFYHAGRGRLADVVGNVMLMAGNDVEKDGKETTECDTSSTTPADATTYTFVYTTIGFDPRFPVPPGDLGIPVEADVNNPEVAVLVHDGMVSQGFNQYSSDLMSVRRRLKDVRDPWCREPGRYPADLPPTSIVIVLYNEAWSVLLRTVHSILDRSPAYLIREIVLVDDFSYLPHLKTQLDEYFAPNPKVRIMHAPQRLGLIRARMLGGKSTKTDIITYLDAHVEVTVGWLEALIDPVAKNRTTITIPTIDWINENNMLHDIKNAPAYVGAYDWDLNFGWWYRDTLKKRYENRMEPFDTPAMAGGLFTISRAFFDRLGWYDEGFDIYGIENIELSMKSWMCGGKMVTVPCSRVAHIQKAGHPYLNNEKKDVVQANSMRLAEVWMDEYKQVIFDIHGVPHYLEDKYGSVAARKAVREGANCQSFKYYLKNAFPEMRNPLVPGAFRGEVHSVALGNASCLTFHPGDMKPIMAPCNHLEKDQFWTHNYYQEVNSDRMCVDAIDRVLQVYQCHRARGNQAWQYLVESQQIKSVMHGSCWTLDLETNSTIVQEICDATKPEQKWGVTLIDLDISMLINAQAKP